MLIKNSSSFNVHVNRQEEVARSVAILGNTQKKLVEDVKKIINIAVELKVKNINDERLLSCVLNSIKAHEQKLVRVDKLNDILDAKIIDVKKEMLTLKKEQRLAGHKFKRELHVLLAEHKEAFINPQG